MPVVQAAHVAEAEAAFKEVFKLAKPGGSSSHMFRVYAHMKQVWLQHKPAHFSIMCDV